MPDLGPMGRGGARRRTRRRMTAMNEMANQNEPSEDSEMPIESDKLMKLARLLKDKGVISEDEFNLLFG
jgi:hypothetical protein